MDLDTLLEPCTDLVKDTIISIVASIIAEKLTGWKSTHIENPPVTPDPRDYSWGSTEGLFETRDYSWGSTEGLFETRDYSWGI